MKGNKLCLCFLLAAGVGLGAHAQDKIAAPMKDVNQVVDNTLDSLNVARSARPVSGSSRKGDNPVLFLYAVAVASLRKSMASRFSRPP